MSMILDYKNWKKLFEQQTVATQTVQPDKTQAFNNQAAEAYLAQKITPEIVKNILVALTTVGGSDQTKYLNLILEKKPDFSQGIIERYGLKTVSGMMSNCDRIFLGNIPGFTATVPMIGDSYLLLNTNDTLIVKKAEEFSNWISSLNYEKWKKGDNQYSFRNYAKLVVRIGDVEGPTVRGVKPIRSFKRKDGKSANIYVYIISEGNKKELSEYGEAGNSILLNLKEAYELDTIIVDTVKELNVDIPKLFVQEDTTIQTKKQFLIFNEGKERIKSKLLAAETTTIEINKEPFEVSRKWSNLKFPTDIADLGQDQIDAMKEAITLLKEEINKKDRKNITLDQIKVIASASNHYTNPVPATHSNSGEINKEYKGEYKPNEDPSPGKSHKDLKLAEANNKLAWSRAENFSKKLMELLQNDEELKAKGIKFSAPTIEWRITDTGGKVDNTRDKNEHPNPGQYVEVKLGVKGDIETKEPKVVSPKKTATVFSVTMIPTFIYFLNSVKTSNITQQQHLINQVRTFKLIG
jgi:hypothetical protein